MAVISVGGWHHETNTFAPTRATFEAFAREGGRPALARGEAMFQALAGYTLPAPGFIEDARAAGHRLLPLLWGEATPSAQVTEETYERIAAMLLEDLAGHLRSATPPDALYLCLHGAMVAEHFDDGEGEFLRRVRALVGDRMPVVASLDLHANVTRAMVERTDVMVAYRTYPHVDRPDAGKRAFAAMERLLSGRGPVFKAFRQADFLIPLTWQCTMVEPMAGVYALLEELEKAPGVVSLSLLPGFPLADIPDCGPSVLAYADTQAAADTAANRLLAEVEAREPAFAGRLWGVDEAVERAKALAAKGAPTTILVDTQDNPGAGANGDTVGLLEGLIRHGAEDAYLGLLYDPEAALAAHAAGEGAEAVFSLGARSGLPGHRPFEGTFRVEKIGDGSFTATGPFYKGYRMRLGPMALLGRGGVHVLVASRKQQAADRDMFRHLGVEPGEHRILALKSSVHFRADFTDIAGEILVVEAPGPSIADPAKLPFKRLRPGLRTSPGGRPLA